MHGLPARPAQHSDCLQVRQLESELDVDLVDGSPVWYRDGEEIRRVAEYIAAGEIGRGVETHTILGRNFGGSGDRPASKPVPAGLHWDEWIGPAPYRDYHDIYFPGPKWYRWWDFGNGTMSDLGSHWNDQQHRQGHNALICRCSEDWTGAVKMCVIMY